MQQKCLITGFEPFGNDTINPSWEAVQALPDEIGGIQVIKCRIPTVFAEGFHQLKETIDQMQPDYVFAVGQAGGRSAISVEKVAINYLDARIADNCGNQPVDEPILPEGPSAYFSTLPVRAIVMAMHEQGIPAAVSYTAGTFVCNELMYRLLHYLDKTSCKAGFIHVPYLPSQVAGRMDQQPSMTLEMITQALTIAIKTLGSEMKQNPSVPLGTIQ